MYSYNSYYGLVDHSYSYVENPYKYSYSYCDTTIFKSYDKENGDFKLSYVYDWPNSYSYSYHDHDYWGCISYSTRGGKNEPHWKYLYIPGPYSYSYSYCDTAVLNRYNYEYDRNDTSYSYLDNGWSYSYSYGDTITC